MVDGNYRKKLGDLVLLGATSSSGSTRARLAPAAGMADARGGGSRARCSGTATASRRGTPSGAGTRSSAPAPLPGRRAELPAVLAPYPHVRLSSPREASIASSPASDGGGSRRRRRAPRLAGGDRFAVGVRNHPLQSYYSYSRGCFPTRRWGPTSAHRSGGEPTWQPSSCPSTRPPRPQRHLDRESGRSRPISSPAIPPPYRRPSRISWRVRSFTSMISWNVAAHLGFTFVNADMSASWIFVQDFILFKDVESNGQKVRYGVGTRTAVGILQLRQRQRHVGAVHRRVDLVRLRVRVGRVRDPRPRLAQDREPRPAPEEPQPRDVPRVPERQRRSRTSSSTARRR